jgi:hypothetical protein
MLGFQTFMSYTVILISIILLAICVTEFDKIVHFGYASINQTDFDFVAVGDWDCNHNTQDTVNNIITKNPKLVLGLGDYSYNRTANCWLKLISPFEDRLKIAIGNHEIPSDTDDEYHLSEEAYTDLAERFNLTEQQYYSFNYNNVHFTALSTELLPFDQARQKIFLEGDLAKASSDPNLDWIIVYLHRPLYTFPGAHNASDGLRNMYHPIFMKYGVDLVLQGHNHNYQRSYPIEDTGSSNSTQSIKATVNTTNEYIDPKGQIFVIVGTGGADLYDVTEKPCNRDAGQTLDSTDEYYYMFCSYKGYGFLDIGMATDGRKLSATFYANNGSNMDHFSITKNF